MRAGIDWLTNVALGREYGYSLQLVQGLNQDVDTGSVPEDIVPWGGLYAFQTSAVAMEVVSDSVSDSADGTGLRTASVTYLDASLAEHVQQATLNGTTPVALPTNCYRVNTLRGLTAGGNGTNVGTVTVRTVAGAVPQAQIPPGYGRSQTCVYTVPAGYTAWLLDGFFSLSDVQNASAFAALQVVTRNAGGVWASRAFVTCGGGMPTVALQPRAIGPIGPGGDLLARAVTVGNNNSQLAATLSVILQRIP